MQVGKVDFCFKSDAVTKHTFFISWNNDMNWKSKVKIWQNKRKSNKYAISPSGWVQQILQRFDYKDKDNPKFVTGEFNTYLKSL